MKMWVCSILVGKLDILMFWCGYCWRFVVMCMVKMVCCFFWLSLIIRLRWFVFVDCWIVWLKKWKIWVFMYFWRLSMSFFCLMRYWNLCVKKVIGIYSILYWVCLVIFCYVVLFMCKCMKIFWICVSKWIFFWKDCIWKLDWVFWKVFWLWIWRWMSSIRLCCLKFLLKFGCSVIRWWLFLWWSVLINIWVKVGIFIFCCVIWKIFWFFLNFMLNIVWVCCSSNLWLGSSVICLNLWRCLFR